MPETHAPGPGAVPDARLILPRVREHDSGGAGRSARRTAIGSLLRILFAVAALWPAVAHEPARAQPEPGMAGVERHIKAVFLYKFAPYVTWPVESYARADAPFVIAATSADMVRELALVTRGRFVGGHRVVVRPLSEGDGLAGVHIVFVAAAQAPRLAAIAVQTRDRPVLIVSEVPGGLKRGAAINFAVVEGRVRFKVALAAAEKRRLAISSRLLTVAKRVRTESM